MLLFLLLVLFLTPSVLGHCCMPMKLFAVRVNILTGLRSNTFVDFEKQRILIKPRVPANHPAEFFFKDIRQGKMYVKDHRGNCKISSLNPQAVLRRCIPPKAVPGDPPARTFGTPGRSMATFSWKYEDNGFNIQMTVSAKKCIPITRIATSLNGDFTTPIAFYNTIVMDNTDDYFNVDLSNCAEGPISIG